MKRVGIAAITLLVFGFLVWMFGLKAACGFVYMMLLLGGVCAIVVLIIDTLVQMRTEEKQDDNYPNW